MDEDLILREIVKNLAFEIEAANQDNVLKWTTANGTPLHVKVRVRNKDEPRLIQRGAIPVPRIGISAPDKLRLISSDQTILSFNVYLEETLENEPKRHHGLKIFNIGNCLGTYSDDEGPYLPGSSEQETLGTDNISNSGSVALNKEVATALCPKNTVPNSQKDQKGFFGKCKPGGCLDPPFGEDSYAYDRTTNPQENVRIELHKLQDTKETYEPGGCLDPPLNDDGTSYSTPKAYKQQENLELYSDYSLAKNQVLTKKSLEASLRHKSLDKKEDRKEDDSKKLMGIYTRTSRENSLESKYSNSIITYPTDVSSSETLFEQSTYKKDSIISKNAEQVQSHDNPVSYYVPPKDVTRYKEDERKYNKRLSSDKIDRSDIGVVHDMVDKIRIMEDGNISQKTIGLECTRNEDPEAIVCKQVSKDVAEGTQANRSFKDIPSFISGPKKDERYQNSLDEKFKLTDPIVIESNFNKKENSNFIIQKTSLAENNEQSNKNIENLEVTLNTESFQRQPNTPMIKSPGIEVKEKFSPIHTNYAFDNQISDSCSANSEQLTIQSVKQLSKDFAEGTQANQSFKDIPSFISDSKKVERYKNSPDEKIKLDSRAIESNVYKKENSNCILQTKITSLTGNDVPSNKNIENFDETLKTENYQTQPDTLMFKRSDIQIKEKLPPLNANYVSKNQISDSCSADTDQPSIQSIKQLILNQDIPHFSDSLNPIPDNSNLGVTDDKTVFNETPVPHASRYISPGTILSSPDKQSEANAETHNVSKMHSEDLLRKSSNQKLDLHEKPNELSPQRISSNENNEFDVSSEHSLDLNQEFLNFMKTCSPKHKLSQKENDVLSSESLSATRSGNVIISKHVSIDNYIKVTSEFHEKRTSEILQKKPYTARDIMDIQHDDINKTTPLKRNTFTVLSSDTSIKKHEEIEEIPENEYEYLKSHKKPERDSPAITYDDLDTQVIHNKNLEVSITSSFNILPREIDLQSEVSIDNKYLNKKDDSNTNNEKQENTIPTESEKRLLPNPAENVTNVSSAINETKFLDSIPKENEMLKVSSRNYLPLEARSTQSSVANDLKSFLSDQKSLKVDILKTAYKETENINTQYNTTDLFHRPADMISVRKKSLDKVSKDLDKTVYEECINDSLNNTMPSTLKGLQTESKTSVPENQLENNDLRAKITTNGKRVANLTSETIPENNKDLYNNNLNGKSSLSTLSGNVKDMGIENANTTYNLTTQDLLTNDLYSEMTENAKYISDSPETARTVFSNVYDNLNVNPTNFVLPEHIQDLNSKNTVRNQEKIDIIDLEEQLDGVAHSELNTDIDFVPTILRKVELPIQITNGNTYVVTDQLCDENEFLDAHDNELHEKIDINSSEYDKNIESNKYKSETLISKTELNEGQYFKDNDNRDLEKTESILKNKSLSGKCLSPLGEVLSNISKKEEENSKQTERNNLDESIKIYEAFSKINTKSRDQKPFDSNFESTIMEQRSTEIMSAKSDAGNNVMAMSPHVPINSLIKSSIQRLKLNNSNIQIETIPEVEHTKKITTNFDKLSQQFDDYANQDSPLNKAGDVTFVDNSAYKSGQPIKYNSSTIPASIHDVNVLNKDIFRRNSSKLFTYNKQPSAIKLKENKDGTNLVETESMPTQNDLKPLYLNMSFYSYVNGNKQRVVETQSPITIQQTPNDGTITVVKTLIRYGNEIRIPVDNENDITLNILDKDKKAERNGSFVGSPIIRTLRAKHVLERCNRNDEVLNKNLALIYESELIPLHSVIKDLTQEVNSLAAKQEILQTRLRSTKRTKSLRVIPIVKRCGCRRI